MERQKEKNGLNSILINITFIESLKEKLTLQSTNKSRQITRAQAKPVSSKLKLINKEVEVKNYYVRPIQQEDVIMKKTKDVTSHSQHSEHKITT